jgi:hypothetical protein
MKMFTCKFSQDEVTHQRLRVGSKKSVQQGRSHFDAQSVCGIREHGKMARTPLAAFFNRPILWTMANGLSDQLKVKQAKGLTTPLL